MRENPALIALAEQFADDQRGTPAGNAGLTQEQLVVMRERGLLIEHVSFVGVMVPARPPCPGDIPDEHRAQAEMVEMPCPVMGCMLMGPGDRRMTLLLPTGTFGVSGV
jgi:hypothetical protein